MNLNKINHAIVTTTLITSMACLALPNFAFANKSFAQSCKLGETCAVPGNDGGQTIFKMSPATGIHYICEIKSNKDSLKFAITSGKEFSITKGNGVYNANPAATVAIEGRFEHPNNPHDEGEIRITKLPFSSDGTVKCYPKQS